MVVVILGLAISHFSKSSFPFFIASRFSSLIINSMQRSGGTTSQWSRVTFSSLALCIFHELNTCFFSLIFGTTLKRGSCCSSLHACSHDIAVLIRPSVYWNSSHHFPPNTHAAASLPCPSAIPETSPPAAAY